MTDHVPTVIFGLLVVAVGVFVVMGCFVVGPPKRLMRVEKVILGTGLVGIAGVMVYAASELLFHVLF